MNMNMRYLTKQNFQIYLETSITYFNTEDFNWSVYNYTLTISCVGYNSLHKVATLPGHWYQLELHLNYSGTTGINWSSTRRNSMQILSTRKLKTTWN